MSIRTLNHRLTPVALAAMVWTGCAFDDASLALQDRGGGCVDDHDCGAVQVCVAGRCAEDVGGSWHLDVQIEPGPGADLVVQQRLDVDLGSGNAFEIAMERPVTLNGLFSGAAGAGTPTPDGSVQALRNESIPSMPLRYNATVQTDHTFALVVAPDTRYRVDALPTDTASLPQQTAFDVLPGDAALSFGWDQSTLVTFSGRVVVAATSTPVAGVRVRAVTADGRLHSTTVLSSASGDFSIGFLPELLEGGPDKARFDLRLTPTSDNPFFPTVVVPGLFASDTCADAPTGCIETAAAAPQIVVPIADLGGPFDVCGQVRSEDDVFISSALVVFEADVGGGKYDTQARTDETGAFCATLLAGAAAITPYEIAVVPRDADPAAGALSFASDLAPGGEPLEIVLPARLALSGIVFDARGSPVPDAEVVADLERVAGPGANSPRQWTGVTDAEGVFGLAVDAGTYGLSVRPPASSGLPWHTLRVTVVASTVVDITVPPAGFLRGTVRDPEGQAISGISLRFFQRTEAGDSVVEVGRTTSEFQSKAGSFTLALPSP